MQILINPSESEFQRDVIELAKLLGWRVWHQVPTMVRPGRWATAGVGDPGFPDLALAHPTRGAMFWELKTNDGKVSAAQQLWLEQLQAAGIEAAVCRPRDMGWMIARLQGVAA